MIKVVCDICGEPIKHQFKIKKYNRMLNTWKKFELCDKCYDAIEKIRYEKSLEERLDGVISGMDKYDTVPLQTAYLSGVQDCYDILLHNKIQKGKIK